MLPLLINIALILLIQPMALVADSENMCRMVSKFGKVCKVRKLRVNVGKSKVMRCSRCVNVSQII